jgi:polyhydroxybutyrate depolymerase
VLSGEATAAHFRILAGAPDTPTIEQHSDLDPGDGASVETRRWLVQGREVVLMVVHGGGHTLPHPRAPFPADIVGRTSRDVDGARMIWVSSPGIWREIDGTAVRFLSETLERRPMQEI